MFPSSTISAGMLAKIRDPRGATMNQVVIFDNPTVALKFNSNALHSGSSASQVTYSSTLFGSYTNVKVGMLVIASPTSDYASDLKNTPEQCLYSYVRTTPSGSGTLTIGLTSYTWTTSTFFTVLRTFNVHYKPLVMRTDGVIDHYKDATIAYRLPLPRISGLQSEYASFVTTSASFSVTATGTAEAPSASISSWSWTAIYGNASLSGSGASRTITINAGLSDWIHVVVTDSNGNTNWFAFRVHAISKSSLTPIENKVLSSDYTIELGQSPTMQLQCEGDVSDYLDHSRFVVIMLIEFGDGTSTPFVNNIDFVGELVGDTIEVSGDDELGADKSSTFRGNSLPAVANQIKLPALPLLKNSPLVWGYFSTLNVFTPIWYLISEHTTFGNVSSIEIESGYDSYQAVGFQTEEGGLLDAIDTLSFMYGGNTQFAKAGGTKICRSLVYEESDTVRNNATEIATFTNLDGETIEVERETFYTAPKVLLGAGSFNVLRNTMDVYTVRAPSVPVMGFGEEKVNSQLLIANTSQTIATVEAGKRAGNHWAASNPTPVVTVDLLGGWRDIVPDSSVWYKLALASTDNYRGIVYDNDTRFICIGATYTHNHFEGVHQVSLRLREETINSNYAVDVQFVDLNVEKNPVISWRPSQPYLKSKTPNPYDPNNDNSGTGGSDSNPPDTPNNVIPKRGRERLIINSKGSEATTSFSTVAGQTYTIQIQGFYPEHPNWCKLFAFNASAGGWATLYNFGPSGSYGSQGSWDGNRWASNYRAASQEALGAIDISFPFASTVTDVILDSEATIQRGSADNGLVRIYTATPPYDGSDVTGINTANAMENDPYARKTSSWSGSEAGINFARCYFTGGNFPEATAEYVYVYGITLKGTGQNPFGQNNCPSAGAVVKDAFYQWTGGNSYTGVGGAASVLTGSNGLLIDKGGGFNPVSSVPSQQVTHSYIIYETGNGNPWSFKIEDGDYTGNTLKSFQIYIEGAGIP